MGTQMGLQVLINHRYPPDDRQGIKSVVVAHSIYRSIICLLMSVCGWYFYRECISTGAFTSHWDQQTALLELSRYYMIFDLLFFLITERIETTRCDLIIHHLAALLVIEFCNYFQFPYAWSMIALSELLSIWTGVGRYARYQHLKNLEWWCYLARTITIVCWRLPLWFLSVSYLGNFGTLVQYFFMGCLVFIVGMDLYWLSRCIHRIVD